ncbi:hypothetical protein H6P81_001533 [Aristolochia fimbriata]|uniref:Uncharacterized protein n=1 Tax=Aristolochia fimbriata TaxID=158543 RepID=A0AAV7F760_ARIFI|nr:hypothetical protein H6P81_001533 [Aristolochia fimbriata]
MGPSAEEVVHDIVIVGLANFSRSLQRRDIMQAFADRLQPDTIRLSSRVVSIDQDPKTSHYTFSNNATEAPSVPRF